VEKLNMADGLVFNSEKQLKEYGDKIPADKKQAIESAVAQLKDAHKNEDIAGIDAAMETLNAAWQAASSDMYAQGGQPGAEDAAQAGANNADNTSDVADAEYEEVK
jgi:molecular chaperone DnaK